jgi:transposase
MPTTTSTNAGARKLEHLPVIAAVLKRLKIAEKIDELGQPDPRNVVTTGQCIEAMVVAILTGTHTLYRVDQLLAGYDLELGLGWKVPAGRFHDERLARSLDDVVKIGLNKVPSAVFMQALREYELGLAIMRLDTTSGSYSESEPPAFPEDPEAIPHVTKGRSKDHRGLKQIVFGTAVTEEGFPAYGRAASGNRADPCELRFLMRRVAERVPDPTGTTIVGDSKLCAAETLLLARRLGFHFVTLLPKSTNARDDALRGYRAARGRGELEVFLQKEGRSGEIETWRGCSVPVFVDHEDKTTKEKTRVLLRAVVVESSGLARQKRAALEKERERERLALEKEGRAQIRKVYRCDADADEAALRLRARTPRFHTLVTKTCVEDVLARRLGPGRPKKGERRKTERVFRAWFTIQGNEDAFEAILAEESSFVLVTSHPTVGDAARSTRAIFETYHGQWGVERVMHWFKGALDFAPVFLKTPSRIAALTQVYVIALMVYALIQREARRELATRETEIAGNLRPTVAPTTEVVFRLFEKVTTARRVRSGGDRHREPHDGTGSRLPHARARRAGPPGRAPRRAARARSRRSGLLPAAIAPQARSSAPGAEGARCRRAPLKPLESSIARRAHGAERAAEAGAAKRGSAE